MTIFTDWAFNGSKYTYIRDDLYRFNVRIVTGNDLYLTLSSPSSSTTQASVVCDIVVLYFLKARQFYRRKKYQDVVDPIGEYVPIDPETSTDGHEQNLINNPTVSLSSKKSDKF